jgi:tetratricopeptide (TPR) repeat protein
VGDHPEVKSLEPAVAAEVLLCVGILTSWIGSREGIEKSQEAAKNLISEGITLFESAQDSVKVAASRAEIAYCYFREGALDEARIMLTEALQKLPEGNTKARALLKLTTVEWSASRYDVALEILSGNASLFGKITNHTIRGNYHNELAVVLKQLALVDPFKREKLRQQAIKEFKTADHHFQLARNKVFAACVKNNLGLIFFDLSRFKEAHRYFEEARLLSVRTKNKVQMAVIDESRARVLVAEGRYKAAEVVARYAVRVLDKSGHQSLLAEALTTHGIALARLGKTEQAQFTLQRAFDTARQAGALNQAGLAALTLIEELDEAETETLSFAFDCASEWLPSPQSEELWRRLNAAARKVFARLHGEPDAEVVTDAPLNRPFNFHEEILRVEETLIRNTLSKVNGSITRAAKQMGMTYQGLGYIIQRRHPKLLKDRSPVRPRARKKDMQSQRVSQD